MSPLKQLLKHCAGKPLFPGRDYHHQLSLILNVLGKSRTFSGSETAQLRRHLAGTPSLDDFYAINSSRSREYIRYVGLSIHLVLCSCNCFRALPFRKRTPFSQLFPKANPLAIDLMESCLTFNPARRITVEQALAHPYLEVRVMITF